jgi:hypothetical protein
MATGTNVIKLTGNNLPSYDFNVTDGIPPIIQIVFTSGYPVLGIDRSRSLNTELDALSGSISGVNDNYGTGTVTAAPSSQNVNGTGAEFSITFNGGVTSISVTTEGVGYAIGDTFTWTSSDLNTAIGNGSGTGDLVITLEADENHTDLGHSGAGFGPTVTDEGFEGTNFWSGITPSTGTYTTYKKKNPDVNGPSIRLISEDDITSFMYNEAGLTPPETNAYGRIFSTQSLAAGIPTLAFPRDIENFYTEGLYAYIDASQPHSYASGSGQGFVLIGRSNSVGGDLWKTWFNPKGDTSDSEYKRYSPNDAGKNVINGSITFDSTEKEYIEAFGAISNTPLVSTFTQQFLVYVDGSQSDGRIFIKPESGTGDNGYEVYLDGLEIVIKVAGETTSSGVSVNNNSWNFITVTLTDTQNKVSINNGSVTTNTRTVTTDLSDVTSTNAFLLGGDASTAGTHFNGKLAVFLHYKDELTSDQKTQNWKIFKGRFGL